MQNFVYIYHFALITMHVIQRATILSEKFLNFPIQFSNVTQKKMSQKTFDYQLLNRTAKNPIFSTISFAAIMFLIYTNRIVSNLSMTTTFDMESNEIIDPHEMITIAKNNQHLSLCPLLLLTCIRVCGL